MLIYYVIFKVSVLERESDLTSMRNMLSIRQSGRAPKHNDIIDIIVIIVKTLFEIVFATFY